MYTTSGCTCVHSIEKRDVLKPQLSIFLRVCIPAGGGGSGYCRAACQLFCPRFTLPDSLRRQRLWSGSRVSALGLRLQGIGGLHQPLESSWQSRRPGLLPEHHSQTNVWVSAPTQRKRAFEKNQRQIFRKSGNDAFVNYFFSCWKWFEVSSWIARISCSMFCPSWGPGPVWGNLLPVTEKWQVLDVTAALGAWLCQGQRRPLEHATLFCPKSTKNTIPMRWIARKA